MNDLDEVFSAEGPLACSIPAYKTRAQQIEMARTIAQTIDERGVPIAEAGTNRTAARETESKAVHAARTLRPQPAANTGQAQRRSDGRGGTADQLRARLNGDETTTANMATRD